MLSTCVIDVPSLYRSMLICKAVHSANVMHVKRPGTLHALRHRTRQAAAHVGQVDRLAEVLKLAKPTFRKPDVTWRLGSAREAVLATAVHLRS